MQRQVKGILFVDYVRMLRSRKDVDWTRHIAAEDAAYLTTRIDPEAWYPMETFERFGLAILEELARGDPFVARAWGRMSVDHLVTVHPGLLVPDDPRESLMRLLVLRRSFFDFEAVSLPEVSDGRATVRIRYGMSGRAEEAACFQTIGFFCRLLEMAGGQGVLADVVAPGWEGGSETEVNLTWDPPT